MHLKEPIVLNIQYYAPEGANCPKYVETLVAKFLLLQTPWLLLPDVPLPRGLWWGPGPPTLPPLLLPLQLRGPAGHGTPTTQLTGKQKT